MEKFQNKYRIPSARLLNWDYRMDGAYFITICTRNREHFFGEIENGIMHLNEPGLIARQYWLEIPEHFSFVELGNFIIMPNHIHGILILNNTVETLQCNVSTTTTGNSIGSAVINEQMAKISPKPGSISTIVRSYKSVVSKHARSVHADFGWQPRFHDHIIRNAKPLETIQNYITNNPLNWQFDKFYN